MNRSSSQDGVTLLASGISAVATSFAIYATAEQFVVTSFNRVLLEYLPGWFIATVIHRFGDFALEGSLLFSGVVLSVIVGAVALAGYRLGSKVVPANSLPAGFALSTLFVFVVLFVVVREVVPVIGPSIVGGAVVTLLGGFSAVVSTDDVSAQRRTLMKTIAGIGVFNVVAHALGLVRRSQTERAERELNDRAARLEAQHMVAQANESGFDVEGIKPPVTEIDDFYVVDINPSPPSIDPAEWQLSITGLVEEELVLDVDDVREPETVHRAKTIRCLSDDIDGQQMDTAIWTGSRLMDLIDDADPNGEYAMLYGADEYYYSIPLVDLEDALIAYGMNGWELPAEHGFPVRILVPDRWGKLQVKWLTEIEIIDAEAGGYWEERGWHGMGPVNSVTKIDRINRPGDHIQLCGHAYAGGRGVETVEVSIDGGETWEDATLGDALSDPDATRQWIYEWESDASDGEYEVYARTVDGEGTTQPEERTEPFPDGATGWPSRTIEPN